MNNEILLPLAALVGLLLAVAAVIYDHHNR